MLEILLQCLNDETWIIDNLFEVALPNNFLVKLCYRRINKRK